MSAVLFPTDSNGSTYEMSQFGQERQASKVVDDPRTVQHQDPRLGKFAEHDDRRKRLLARQPGNFFPCTEEDGLAQNRQAIDLLARNPGECAVDVFGRAYLDRHEGEIQAAHRRLHLGPIYSVQRQRARGI